MEEDDGGEVDNVDLDDDDEDIYGDLESDIFVVPPKKRRIDDVLEQEEYQALVKENLALKTKVKQLQKENKAYSNNISSLYLTAKNEVEKKNFIIKNLTEKLKQVTKSKTQISSKEAEEIFIKCQEALHESQGQATLNEIKKSLKQLSPAIPGLRKRIKAGNMSFFFFQDQGTFQREEMVTFPESSTSSTTAVNHANAGSRDGSQTSHSSESSEQRKQPIAEPHQEHQLPHEILDIPEDQRGSRSAPNFVKRVQDSKNLSCTNNTKRMSPSCQETCDPELKRQRVNEKDFSRTDSDRDKVIRRNSSERYNSYKRNRDNSPSNNNDRHYNRRPEDDRYGRKSENYGRYDTRRNHDNYRQRPPKRFNNDTKFSSMPHQKNTRSRSKSK